MTRWTAEGAIDIAAPPSLVYELVSDVTGYGRWAAETMSAEWIGAATGPSVGARFRGRNRNGWHRWSTVCTVTAAEPDRMFEFRVHYVIPTACWRYEITPTNSGCYVTERTARLSPLPLSWLANLALAGVGDRDARNQRNIVRSLGQLKHHAEALGR